MRGDDGEEIVGDVREPNVACARMEEPLLHPRPPIFYGSNVIMNDILGVIAPAEDAPLSPARIATLGVLEIGKSSLALSVLHRARTSAHYARRRYRSLATARCCGVSRSTSSCVSPIARRTRACKNLCCGALRAAASAVLVLDRFEAPWEDANEGRPDTIEKVDSATAGIDMLWLVVVLGGAQRPLGPGRTRPLIPLRDPLEHEAARDTFTALPDVTDDEPTLSSIAYYSMTALLTRWTQESTSVLDRGVQSRQTNFGISIKATISGPRMKAVGEPALDSITVLCLVPDGFSEESLGEITRALPQVGKAAGVLRQTVLAYDDVINLPGPAPPPAAAALAVSPAAKSLEAQKPASNDARAVRRLCIMGSIRAFFCASRKQNDDRFAAPEGYYISLAARAAKIGAAEDGDLVQVLRLGVGNMHCIIERILAKDLHQRDAVQATADLGRFLRHTFRGSLRTSSWKLAMRAVQAIGGESLKGDLMVCAADVARERGDVEGAAVQREAAMNMIRDV
ncbi:hypothetical protein AURDEDRAFT_160999 [Auricularia subglabra TFB-10046 SS5]|nr:hypothetical protein AURDEDRAFT_160999 [Auricularia subglabra TFB-10046 SS5]